MCKYFIPVVHSSPPNKDSLLSLPCNSTSDLPLIQHDIDLISSRISSKSLTINSSKTKYMHVHLSETLFFLLIPPPPPPLYLNGSLLELVYSFKYLGIISCNLSWSLHIQSISRKSRQLIGLLFHHFYRHSSPSALFKLYTSLVRPHYYCSAVWDPSLPSD